MCPKALESDANALNSDRNIENHTRSTEKTFFCDVCSIAFSAKGIIDGRGGLVVRSRLWGGRVPGPRPDSTEDPPCMGPVAR
ncbi:hypothetical protein AVEN_49294-1 [Araneus ventricosus]|uniref:Uncharacterized protein n=1 Tax=Araneus ventricosus TaxID=182803 RepID=A0A4Y2KQB5_ARAVE|nr:hypothetical protein AVEN_49294-1 [Araneus ventricosus]